MEGIIVEIEIDGALSDAVVLSGVLDDGLKEVRFEVEDLDNSRAGSDVKLICSV